MEKRLELQEYLAVVNPPLLGFYLDLFITILEKFISLVKT